MPAGGRGLEEEKGTHSDMIAFDTRHAAETLTDAGSKATHAKAIVAALSEAVGEPITRADLDPLATKADLEHFATKADLAAIVRLAP